MNDDLDRQVCAWLEKDLQLGPDWEITNRTFEDPGMTLEATIYKGTASEQKAYIVIRWRV